MMYTVYNNKKECTGCGTCSMMCSQQCIEMKIDEEGFLYPEIDHTKCIDCGLCRKYCHFTIKHKLNQNPIFYAGFLKDIDELEFVSSGGAAWAFTQSVIENGGVVYGAVEEKLGRVVHQRADNYKDAKLFRRSKYLQSDTTAIFPYVKKDLDNNKYVLFTGTGCQIAALKAFLDHNYDNLVTCDVVCHGVPSEKAFFKYIQETGAKEKKEIESVNFRNKSKGWNHNQYELILSDSSRIIQDHKHNSFYAGYLSGFFYRPSCGECKYAKLPRLSDVTVADFWKYRGALLSDNRNKGISLIVCSTDKGKMLLDKSCSYMFTELVESDMAISSCRHLTHSPKASLYRDYFFELLKKKSYEHAYLKASHPSFIVKMLAYIKKFAAKG